MKKALNIKGGLTGRIVSTLPDKGEDGYLYLVLKDTTEEGDIYDEYLWVLQEDGKTYGWEHLGATHEVRLEVDDKLSLESENPVQNKVVTEALQNISGIIHTSVADINAAGGIEALETGIYTLEYLAGVKWDGSTTVNLTACPNSGSAVLIVNQDGQMEGGGPNALVSTGGGFGGGTAEPNDTRTLGTIRYVSGTPTYVPFFAGIQNFVAGTGVQIEQAPRNAYSGFGRIQISANPETDWEQTQPTEASYIKNRPFFKTEGQTFAGTKELPMDSNVTNMWRSYSYSSQATPDLRFDQLTTGQQATIRVGDPDGNNVVLSGYIYSTIYQPDESSWRILHLLTNVDPTTTEINGWDVDFNNIYGSWAPTDPNMQFLVGIECTSYDGETPTGEWTYATVFTDESVSALGIPMEATLMLSELQVPGTLKQLEAEYVPIDETTIKKNTSGKLYVASAGTATLTNEQFNSIFNTNLEEA